MEQGNMKAKRYAVMVTGEIKGGSAVVISTPNEGEAILYANQTMAHHKEYATVGVLDSAGASCYTITRTPNGFDISMSDSAFDHLCEALEEFHEGNGY